MSSATPAAISPPRLPSSLPSLASVADDDEVRSNDNASEVSQASANSSTFRSHLNFAGFLSRNLALDSPSP